MCCGTARETQLKSPAQELNQDDFVDSSGIVQENPLAEVAMVARCAAVAGRSICTLSRYSNAASIPVA